MSIKVTFTTFYSTITAIHYLETRTGFQFYFAHMWQNRPAMNKPDIKHFTYLGGIYLIFGEKKRKSEFTVVQIISVQAEIYLNNTALQGGVVVFKLQNLIFLLHYYPIQTHFLKPLCPIQQGNTVGFFSVLYSLDKSNFHSPGPQHKT